LDDQDDLDGHFLFAPARTDEPGKSPAGGSRQRPGVCLENSPKQIIQVVQVILTPLPQRFLATIRVVPLFSGGRPGRPGATGVAQLGLARGRPPEGQSLRSVVLSMGRSYAYSVEVRMKGDIGDLQSNNHGQLCPRIAIRPHVRAEGNSRAPRDRETAAERPGEMAAWPAEAPTFRRRRRRRP